MFDSELNSFLWKFHQLRKSGVTAHLDVDTHAGQAWVGLRVMLGPIQHPPAPKHRSPSYFRRQEKRKAAAAAARESNEVNDEVVAEAAATETEEENAVKAATSQGNTAAEAATSSEIVAKEFNCEICDFSSNRRTGLQVHMGRKHARIEQLDGNSTIPIEDQFDEEMENYLQSGYIRDSSLKGPGGPYDETIPLSTCGYR